MQERLGDRDGRSGAGARSDDERQELRIGEGRRTVADEPLPRPDGFGPVADRHVVTSGLPLRSTRIHMGSLLDRPAQSAYSSHMRLLAGTAAGLAGLTLLVGTGVTDALDSAVLAALLPLRSAGVGDALGAVTLLG